MGQRPIADPYADPQRPKRPSLAQPGQQDFGAPQRSPSPSFGGPSAGASGGGGASPDFYPAPSGGAIRDGGPTSGVEFGGPPPVMDGPSFAVPIGSPTSGVDFGGPPPIMDGPGSAFTAPTGGGVEFAGAPPVMDGPPYGNPFVPTVGGQMTPWDSPASFGWQPLEQPPDMPAMIRAALMRRMG